MARVIATATPFEGHVGPILTIAADLARRGHDILVVTGARFADRVRAAGCRFEPLPAAADFDDRDLAGRFPEFADVRVGPPMHTFFWQRVFVDAVPAQYEQLTDLLGRFEADVVLHDTVYLGALPLVLDPVAHPGGGRAAGGSARPLVVGIGVLPPVLLSDDTPPFGPGLPYVAGPVGRACNRVLNDITRETYSDLQAYAEKVFESLGVVLPDFLFTSAVTVPDHYLQLTVPGFEYPRPGAPESLRFIGALPPPIHPAGPRPDWWDQLSGERPLVMVTQGTLANENLGDLIGPTVQGLADLDVTVVAVTARPDGPAELAGLLGEVPANALLGGYVPFDALLPEVDVMVTNGGYGGVNTALRNGVPLVVAGDSEDKPEVAARVAWSGTGVDLRTGTPGPAAVADAVRRVLADPGYRARARALSRQYHRTDPLGAVADVVAGSCCAAAR